MLLQNSLAVRKLSELPFQKALQPWGSISLTMAGASGEEGHRRRDLGGVRFGDVGVDIGRELGVAPLVLGERPQHRLAVDRGERGHGRLAGGVGDQDASAGDAEGERARIAAGPGEAAGGIAGARDTVDGEREQRRGVGLAAELRGPPRHVERHVARGEAEELLAREGAPRKASMKTA